MPEAAGSSLREALGELDGGRVSQAGEHHVRERVDLFVERRVYTPVAVPEEIDPPGADRIEDAAPLEIVEPDPFRAGDRQQGQSFVVPHLSARMPDRTQAALGEFCVRAHAVVSI